MLQQPICLFSVVGWELTAAGGAGLTISQFRFTLAFVVSVVVGAALRLMPTVRGARGGRARALGISQGTHCVPAGTSHRLFPCARRLQLEPLCPAPLATCVPTCRPPYLRPGLRLPPHLLPLWERVLPRPHPLCAGLRGNAAVPRALRHRRLAHRLPLPHHGVSAWRWCCCCRCCRGCTYAAATTAAVEECVASLASLQASAARCSLFLVQARDASKRRRLEGATALASLLPPPPPPLLLLVGALAARCIALTPRRCLALSGLPAQSPPHCSPQ